MEMDYSLKKLASFFKFFLRIGSCLACVYRVMDARGKFSRAREKRKNC